MNNFSCKTFTEHWQYLRHCFRTLLNVPSAPHSPFSSSCYCFHFWVSGGGFSEVCKEPKIKFLVYFSNFQASIVLPDTIVNVCLEKYTKSYVSKTVIFMLEYPLLHLLQGNIFALAINGGFSLEGCGIKTYSLENLRHWGWAECVQYWVSQLRPITKTIFSPSFCPLGTFCLVYFHKLRDHISNPGLILDFAHRIFRLLQISVSSSLK